MNLIRLLFQLEERKRSGSLRAAADAHSADEGLEAKVRFLFLYFSNIHYFCYFLVETRSN